MKQALATVNDYNPLMKDFPLDDLLAATELEKIRAALSAIFTHLKKIRSTKYPIQRALRLVEAISRDLSSQLLKVLYSLQLGHSPIFKCLTVIVMLGEYCMACTKESQLLLGVH